MTVMEFLDKLKAKLISDGDKLNNLAFVAYELSSFYKKIQRSESKSIFPRNIYDELYRMPNDAEYTELTKKVMLNLLEVKLLSIINSIIESTKSKDITIAESHQNVFTNVLTNVGISKFKFKFQLWKFKFSALGVGDTWARKAYKISVFVLCLTCLVVIVYLIMPIGKGPVKPDYAIITESLIREYNSKLEFYRQKRDSLNGVLLNKSLDSEHEIATRSELWDVTCKIDSLTGFILPDLDSIKNKAIDSSTIEEINFYQQKNKNY